MPQVSDASQYPLSNAKQQASKRTMYIIMIIYHGSKAASQAKITFSDLFAIAHSLFFTDEISAHKLVNT